MDFLEYSDIQAEVKGAMAPGKLKLTDQHIIFKNNKTGKVEQISASDVELVNWQKLVGSWGIRIFLKNGTLHRYGGFKDGEQEKISKFFVSNYKKDMLEKELSLKGWNWGTAKFNGSALSFDVGPLTAFEVPLMNVSQCTTGKNEVTLEFHQNDDAAVNLMEMRFHIPSSELAGEDPVDQFQQQVMNKASVISATGDAIAIFREIQCLTPRGRYDIKVFQSFFQLHGKTFDYKIPMSTVLRLFILPHKDGRQMFFVVSLDPPIKQGQTRYHFLVFLFGPDEETTMELPLTEEELQEKYEGRLTKELNGPTCEVLSKVMKAMVNRKITMPGQFVGHSGTPAVGCSYKAAAGYMYPLERGFIYIHKPPVHIRYEEISNVNFARSGGSTRSFDFEVETKSGVVHTFSSIEKEEYNKLFDFISGKKLRMKNRAKTDKPSYADDFGDSDQEGEPDAYLARVKAEAEERDEDGGGGSSEDESEDEDFKPNEDVSDVAEEYDSNVSTSDSESGSGGGSGDEKKEKKKKDKSKKTKTVSEKPRKPRKKKEKAPDDGRPKRPSTAFMMWLNASRESIKSKYPGISVTELSKKGGEMWRELTDKSEWEGKAAQAKVAYDLAMKEFKESGGGTEAAAAGSSKSSKRDKSPTSKSSKASAAAKNASPSKLGAGAHYKSKEYLSDDSSSDEDKKKKSGKGGSEKSAPRAKKIKKEAASEEEAKKEAASEEEASEPASSEEEKKRKKPAKKPEAKVKKEAVSDEGEEESEAGSSDDDKKKKKNQTKKPAKKPEPKGKKASKKSSDEEELEDEEEILSSPTASSDSDSE